MGRGVYVPGDAEAVVYFELDDTTYDDWWDDLIDTLRCSLKRRYPSLVDCDGWQGREGRIILENELAQIGVATYGGVGSLFVVPMLNELVDLGTQWAMQIQASLADTVARNFTVLRKCGTMSNGVSVYERSTT